MLDNTLKRAAICMGVENKINFFHTPFVLPLGTSNQIGGYARSLGFSFGPKFIAINMKRLQKENIVMKEFILMRQIALFDKNSRILSIPLAATIAGIVSAASLTIFSPIIATIITSITVIAGAYIIGTIEEKNEEYADKKAFRQLVTISTKNSYSEGPKDGEKILEAFKEKIEQEKKKSLTSILPERIASFFPKSSHEKRYENLKNLFESMKVNELPQLKPRD